MPKEFHPRSFSSILKRTAVIGGLVLAPNLISFASVLPVWADSGEGPSNHTELVIPSTIELFQNAGWDVKNEGMNWFLTIKPTRRQLALGDFYVGKEWNANEAAKAIMRHFQMLEPGEKYSLINDGVIDFTDRITREKFGSNAELPNWIVGNYDGGVWGGGACWAASTWGAAHDDFNVEIRKLGFAFNFLDNKNFHNVTHAHLYKSYQPMENWDHPERWKHGGYTILQYDNGKPAADYTVQVDPRVATAFPGFQAYLMQDIEFHWGEKPRADLPRDASSYMTSQVTLVLKPDR